MRKIRKNDTVRILTGRDAGKVGKVLSVLDKGQRVTVEKCNIVKRHTKPSQQNRTGGIVDVESPLDISNVALVQSDDSPARVAFRYEEGEGGKRRKVRYSAKNKQVFD